MQSQSLQYISVSLIVKSVITNKYTLQYTLYYSNGLTCLLASSSSIANFWPLFSLFVSFPFSAFSCDLASPRSTHAYIHTDIHSFLHTLSHNETIFSGRTVNIMLTLHGHTYNCRRQEPQLKICWINKLVTQ